jgi:hypothetical protein
LKNVDIGLVSDSVLQWKIESVKSAFAMAYICDLASSRKISGALFVHRKSENFGRKTKSVLHTISVMYIQVNV